MTILPVGSLHIRGSEDLVESDISFIEDILKNHKIAHLHINKDMSADYLETLLTPFVNSGKIKVIQFTTNNPQKKRILRIIESIGRKQ